MKIFLSMICLISFAFSSNMVFSKYSKDFLEKNVLPGLQNEGLKNYYVNCYDKLFYSDDEISNNGWVIPKECNMFKYPIKSSIDNKILQIGSINKEKISLLKEQINKIKEKEQETQNKLEQEIKAKTSIEKTEVVQPNNQEIKIKDNNILSQFKTTILMLITLMIFYIIYRKYNSTNEIGGGFIINREVNADITFFPKIEILKNKKKIEVVEPIEAKLSNDEVVIEEEIKSEIVENNVIDKNLDKIIKERMSLNEDDEEECEEGDEECVCKKYNIRYKKERNLNV